MAEVLDVQILMTLHLAVKLVLVVLIRDPAALITLVVWLQVGCLVAVEILIVVVLAVLYLFRLDVLHLPSTISVTLLPIA